LAVGYFFGATMYIVGSIGLRTACTWRPCVLNFLLLVRKAH